MTTSYNYTFPLSLCKCVNITADGEIHVVVSDVFLALILSLSLSLSQQYVLAVGSSVFHAMFYGELAENKGEIRIPDVEPAAFLAMLK